MFFDIAATILTVLFFGLNIKQFDLIPSMSTFVNCLLWLRYGVLNFSFAIIIVNLVGVLCALFGIYKLCINSSWNLKIFRYVLVVVSIVLLYFRLQIYPVALKYCGFSACICTIVMFGSPLTHLQKVIKSKNVKLLNINRILLSIGVSLSWVLVGVESRDDFVTVPNGIGLGLSIIQGLVYLRFRGPYRDYHSIK